MSLQKNDRHNQDKDKNLNKEDDTYGIFKQEMEVDSDINEDPNRERLLDESVDAYLKSKKEQ
ncbi:hypothetical protein [Pseudalkalibacillus decolorationis]|uniref:hypothetical protein n=1 Tax=Pseudalkalibacillus decolorationis TaxID=163879 RepID=UPI002148CFD5|nr:hypothetical protein [Pseudalkalibacillus decolorationis]